MIHFSLFFKNQIAFTNTSWRKHAQTTFSLKKHVLQDANVAVELFSCLRINTATFAENECLLPNSVALYYTHKLQVSFSSRHQKWLVTGFKVCHNVKTAVSKPLNSLVILFLQIKCLLIRYWKQITPSFQSYEAQRSAPLFYLFLLTVIQKCLQSYKDQHGSK